MKNNKFLLFLWLVLIIDFFFIIDHRFLDFLPNQWLFVNFLMILSSVLKAVFFLPLTISRQLGNFFGASDDFFYIPFWWECLNFGLSIVYAGFLSKKFSDHSSQKKFFWLHVGLVCFYLFILGLLMIIWQLNPKSVLSIALKQSHILWLGSLFVFALIPLIIIKLRSFLDKK